MNGQYFTKAFSQAALWQTHKPAALPHCAACQWIQTVNFRATRRMVQTLGMASHCPTNSASVNANDLNGTAKVFAKKFLLQKNWRHFLFT